MIQNIINDEEMIALHEAYGDACEERTHELEVIEYDIQNMNESINEDIESIITKFSLLNDIDKRRIAHIISTLNIRHGNDKL